MIKWSPFVKVLQGYMGRSGCLRFSVWYNLISFYKMWWIKTDVAFKACLDWIHFWQQWNTHGKLHCWSEVEVWRLVQVILALYICQFEGEISLNKLGIPIRFMSSVTKQSKAYEIQLITLTSNQIRLNLAYEIVRL